MFSRGFEEKTRLMEQTLTGLHFLTIVGLDNKREEFKFFRALEGSGSDDIDFRHQMLVLVNTRRDKDDDVTNWKWFHMAKADIFRNKVCARIVFEGSSEKDEFVYGSFYNGQNIPALYLRGDKFENTVPLKYAVLSPYFLTIFPEISLSYTTGWEWTVEKVLPLDELKKVRAMKCSATILKQLQR